ncbi:L,D-transpeptidase [Bradyrhizobium sp. SRL28]|uniref:L,D-transpeptidase family protein n=1 Tax=Bradyrhizobium sp. SRL28 TaxID=2836178 RepID=UPI001BDDDEC4|nr:L,D-transpeptidase [Bradyrhizobium sp. SRL28]MBT1512160.1 L,D-transpeptidase [Bradyrhizobium sp. SRL28]
MKLATGDRCGIRNAETRTARLPAPEVRIDPVPASHGCVRLHPSHAAALFALVQRNGPHITRIQIN